MDWLAYAQSMNFGTRLAAARQQKKLTQGGLGKGLGTDGKDASKSVVYGWEKNQHFPKVDQLIVICERLGASADYLLFGRMAQSDLPREVLDVASAIAQLPLPQRAAAIELAWTAVKHGRIAAEQVATAQASAQRGASAEG